MKEKAPEFGYALALDEKVEGWVILRKTEKLELAAVRPHRQQINSEFVRNAHEKGIKVFAHFADEEEDMRDLLAMKVDGIVTGRPERLKGVLEGAGG
jgi:glycerophosphoryl diester phosphodiesterase